MANALFVVSSGTFFHGWEAVPFRMLPLPTCLALSAELKARGALETAHRALANCGQVFRFGVATGRVERDVSGDLSAALPPVKGEHFAAVTSGRIEAEV